MSVTVCHHNHHTSWCYCWLQDDSPVSGQEMTCVVLEPSVTRTLQQSSTLYTPPASWGQSLLSLYILHSTYLVSCVLYLNQTWTWTRTSHVQKHLSKLQYFAADGKKCLRMLWKWLDRTEVNLIMCRWLFCGNIVDDLKTCWNSALTILIHLYLIKLFSQQDLWPAIEVHL